MKCDLGLWVNNVLRKTVLCDWILMRIERRHFIKADDFVFSLGWLVLLGISNPSIGVPRRVMH